MSLHFFASFLPILNYVTVNRCINWFTVALFFGIVDEAPNFGEHGRMVTAVQGYNVVV